MATAEQYAQWIVDNAAKKGTPEFDTVAQAYQLASQGYVSVPDTPPVDQNTSGLGDIFTAFQQGAVGSTKALTDVAGADNVASEYLGDVSKELQQEYTPARQEEMRKQAERMKAAEQEGTWAEIKAGAQNIAEAPLQSAAQALGSFVPYIPALLAGPLAGALGLGARGVAVLNAAAPRVMSAVGTAQGAGTAKGAIYDATFEAALADGMSEEEAKQKASVAQEYLGENMDAIAAGASLGFLASRSGAEKMLQAAAKRSAVKGYAKEVGKETLTEAAQGGQERLAANVALQRQGKDVPTFEGVAGQATQEGLTGALGAGTVGLATPQAPKRPEPTGEPTPPEPETPPAPTDVIDPTRSYEDLLAEGERLKQLPDDQKTPEVLDRLRDIERAMREQTAKNVQKLREDQKAETEGAKRFPGLAGKEKGTQEDLFGLRYPEAEQQPELANVSPMPDRGRLEEGPPKPPTNRGLKSGAPGWQYSLGLRGGKMDDIYSMDQIEGVGIPLNTTRGWFKQNVEGKTRAHVENLVTADPKLTQGRGIRARVLRGILAEPVPEPAPYVEPTTETTPEPKRTAPPVMRAGRTAGPQTAATDVSEPGQPESGVGVSDVPQQPSDGAPQSEAGAGTDTGAGGADGTGVAGDGTVPRTPEPPAGEQPAPLGQMTLPGIEPGGQMVVYPEAPEPKVEFASLRDAIAAGVPTYQMSLGEPAPRDRATGSRVAPGSAIINRIKGAKTLPQLEAAMDDLVQTIRNPKGADSATRKVLQDFVEWGMTNIPQFDVAVQQAQDRTRQKPQAAAPTAQPKSDLEQRRADAQVEADLQAEEDAKKLEAAVRAEELRQAEAKAREAEAKAKKAEADAKAAEAKAEETTPAPDTEDTRSPAQRKKEFKKGVAAVTYGSNLQARRDNKALAPAMEAGDTTAVLDALANSKNPLVRKVAEDARKVKGLKVQIDDDAAEYGSTAIDNESRAYTIKSSKDLAALVDAVRTALASPDLEAALDDTSVELYFSRFDAVRDTPEPMTLREAARIISKTPLLLSPIYGTKGDTGVPVIAPYKTTKESLQTLADALEAEVSTVGEDVLRNNASLDPNIYDFPAIAGRYDPATNTVSVGSYFAKDEGVVAHELVHAIVSSKISNPSKADADTVRRLNDLYAYVKQKMTADPDARVPYGLASVQEFIAEGLANPEFQHRLSEIKYQNTTAWGRFVQRIAELLGLKQGSALTELLGIYNTLAIEPQASTGTEETLFARVNPEDMRSDYTPSDLTAPFPDEDQSKLKQLIKGFQNSDDGVTRADKIRTVLIDSAATIERRLGNAFDSAVRDSLGKLNPMGLFRQAQDYTKLLHSFYTNGALVKDKDTNLWRAGTRKGVRPPMAVFELIDNYARERGLNRQDATREASRILTGVRENELKKAKADIVYSLNDAEIARRVKLYQNSKTLQAMSKAMDESRKALVEQMVSTGRLTEQDGKEWLEVVGYVPFDRISQTDDAFSSRKRITTRGATALGRLPELVGTNKLEVGNVFENYINTLGWMVGQVVRNDANNNILNVMQEAGMAGKPKPSSNGMPHSVYTYVDGEKRYWQVASAYDVMAFADGNPSMPGYIRLMSQFANLLRTTVTSLPPFALKQVTDDIQRAILTSGVKNPWALTRDTLVNFAKYSMAELRGIRHPDVETMAQWALTGEYDFNSGKPAASILYEEGFKTRSRLGELFHRLEGVTRASDLAVRKAVYDNTLRETENDQALALTRARELINFRRRGASAFVAHATSTIPFFNAYIQGMDVLYRAATGRRSSASLEAKVARKLFLSRALMIAGFSTMYALVMSDDEDYQKARLRDRDNNWILPGGYTIPVPGEIAAIFKVIPERVVEYMKRKGTEDEQLAMEAVKTAAANMLEQYVGRAVPIPQAIKPVLEAFTNHSFLTGRELEGTYLQGVDPSRRRGANQSELSIAMVDFVRDNLGVEVSPILVDNALRGYFGSVATHVISATDAILNPDRVDRPLHKMAFLSNYLLDPVGGRELDEFYDLRADVIGAKQTLDDLAKRDMDAAEAYANKHADKLEAVTAVNATLREISNIRRYRKYLNGPDGAAEMSKEERTAELERLRKYELDLVGWVREAKREMAKIRREMKL